MIVIGLAILLSQIISSRIPPSTPYPDIVHRLVCPGQNNNDLSSPEIFLEDALNGSECGVPGRPHCLSDAHLPPAIAPLLFRPIPINRADRETLTVIPGVGEQLASAIIQLREREGGIKDQWSLTKITGIGAHKAELIRNYVTFEQ